MATVYPPIHEHHITRIRVSRRTAGAVAAAALALSLGTLTMQHSQTMRPDSPGTAADARLPLVERVLPARSLPESIRAGAPFVVNTPADWASVLGRPGAAAGDALRLERLAFVAGAEERFRSLYPATGRAASTAAEFGSAASAQAELAAEYRQDRAVAAASGARFTPVPVPGLPNGTGWELRGARTTQITTAFTQGAFVYSLKTQFPTNAAGALQEPQMNAAAQQLYLLINGCLAGHPAAAPRPSVPVHIERPMGRV
ncbi:MAG TPA: hypothetical protein VMU39_18005 [Solirubrobacteraceae bacterium]|nr:hypothetical protein [Solirubrobacteraceae bacterium]